MKAKINWSYEGPLTWSEIYWVPDIDSSYEIVLEIDEQEGTTEFAAMHGMREIGRTKTLKDAKDLVEKDLPKYR